MKDFINSNKFLVILFFITTLALTLVYTRHLNANIALNGYGPQDYVNQKLYPENFSKDFLGTSISQHYDRSVIMKTYYWAAEYLNVSVDKFIYFFIFCQTLLFLFAVWKLLLAFKVDRVIALGFLAPLFVFLYISGADMGRFSIGWGFYLQLPLYYAWAHSFFLLALTSFLKDNIRGGFFWLTLSAFCHITIGFYGSLFIGVWYLLNPKKMLNKTFMISFSLFMLAVGAHVFTNVGVSSGSLKSGTMAEADWLKMTKFHCFHWYPLVMKMFTESTKEIISIVGGGILFLLTFKGLGQNESIKKLIPGMVICLLLTPVGIAFSEFYPIPILIKLAPQRASSYASFLFILVYSLFLLKKIYEGRSLDKAISCAAFLSMGFIFNPKILIYTLVGLEVLRKLPLEKINDLIEKKLPQIKVNTIVLVGLVCTFTWAVTGYRVNYTVHRGLDAKKAYAFKEAQEWAKENTEITDLFAVDPYHAYAWRDFSLRSSYGTFRDWGFSGIGYHPDQRLYAEGKRRAKIFGVDIDKITMDEIESGVGPIFLKYSQKTRDFYSSLSPEAARELGNSEGIDYFVFHNHYFKQKDLFKEFVVFKNKYFTIVKMK